MFLGSDIAILFFAIPVIAVLFFIITLILYMQEKKKLSLSPESVNSEKLKKLKTALSASGTIAGVLLGITIILCVLLFFFIANM
ncbi:MAG: hypothetical protein IKL10_00295 [Clostridia bacterium]|nr:hypothetical protein [Clostridia bacterium]